MNGATSRQLATVVPIVPSAPEAERSLIAAITFDPTAWPVVRDLLSAEDFVDVGCRAAWKAACAIDADGLAPELASMTDRLTKEGGPIALPGGWLMKAHAETPSFARRDSWVDQVQRASVARLAASEAREIARRAVEESGNPGVVLAQAAERMSQLAGKLRGPGDTNSRAAVRSLLDAYKAAQARRLAGLSNGVPTGFAKLDEYTGGWRRGNMIVLAARPSIGKSALATQLLAAACRAGVYVAFFSLEMTRDEIMQRTAAQVSGVPFRALLEGNLCQGDEADFYDAMHEIEEWSFEVDERAALLNSEIASTAQRWHSKRPLGLVIIDYLQLAHAANLNRSANRENEVGAVSRSLKALAKRLDCPVIALAQLNREGEKVGRKPMMSDLRESGSIEADADVIMFLHREKRTDGAGYEDDAGLCVAKQRNGMTGVVNLRYQGERARFVDAT